MVSLNENMFLAEVCEGVKKQTQKCKGQSTQWQMYVYTYEQTNIPDFSVVSSLRVSRSLCSLAN